jgi:transposase
MLKIIWQSILDKGILIATIEKQIDEMAKQYAIEVDLLNIIDGVGPDNAISILREIGTDMSRFLNEHHLSSFGGMSPGNNESAGKKKLKNHQSE